MEKVPVGIGLKVLRLVLICMFMLDKKRGSVNLVAEDENPDDAAVEVTGTGSA